MAQKALNHLPFVTTEYLAQLVDSLAHEGISPAKIVHGSGVNVKALLSAQELITPEQYHQIIDNALTITKNPLLALKTGGTLNEASHGFMGLALMACEDLGSAISLAIRFIRTRTLLADIRFYENDNHAFISVHRIHALPQTFPFISQYIVAAILTMLRKLTNQHTDLNATLYLANKAQADEAEYEALLQTKVLFAQPLYQISIPAALLRLPISSANPSSRRIAEAQCEKILAQLDKGQDLVVRIRQQLLILQTFPSLDEMADLLNSSPRTINRQLAHLNTSFQNIIDEIRREQAMQMLMDNVLGVEQIAQRLGYTDPSNFSRAFRRWLGESPRTFRQKHNILN